MISFHGNPQTGVWPIGESIILKVTREGALHDLTTTNEADTLEFVNKQGFSFQTPKLLHCFDRNETRFLFQTRILGRTLHLAMPSLDDKWRKHYARSIVDAIKEMAKLKGNAICGVDGKNLWNIAFSPYVKEDTDGLDHDFNPEAYLRHLQKMKIDCSSFVFHHIDLNMENIIIEDEPEKGTIGIIDWMSGGYVPPGWILTSILATPFVFKPSWTALLVPLLEAEGFTEHTEGYLSVEAEESAFYKAWLDKRDKASGRTKPQTLEELTAKRAESLAEALAALETEAAKEAQTVEAAQKADSEQ